MKPNLKSAVEAVRTACFNSEKITGTQIKKQYGISTHLLPVMIEAGYIQKMKGLKYKWKVQAEILPVMLKVIQDGITKTNMEYLKKSQEKKKKTQKKEELRSSVDNYIRERRRAQIVEEIKKIDISPKIKTERPEVATVSNAEVKKPLPTEDRKVDFKELMNKVDTLIQLNKKDIEIADLKNKLSENSERKFVFRLFGLPIFAISHS